MRHLAWLALCAMLMVGCGESDDTSDEDEVEAVEPEETAVPGEAPPAEETLSYTIHEWGLIDIDLGTTRVEYAAGPGSAEAGSGASANSGGGGQSDRDRRLEEQGREVVNNAANTAGNVLNSLTGGGASRRKPVLYFHLSEPSPDFHFDLTVSLGSAARVLEHFPAGVVAGHQVTWSGVQLGTASCTGGPYPTAESDVCTGVADGYCEAAELADYVADDAGCLSFGDAQQNFLFYRGDGPAPDLPLRIERGEDGVVTVTNTSMGPAVGDLLRLRRSGDTIQVAQISIPPAGGSISVGLPATAAAEPHREVIRAQLRSIGLSDGEAGAFERAWFGELFDASSETPHAFPDAVFFFLPADQIDGYAHLEASPAPSATVRAMAVRAGWTSL